MNIRQLIKEEEKLSEERGGLMDATTEIINHPKECNLVIGLRKNFTHLSESHITYLFTDDVLLKSIMKKRIQDLQLILLDLRAKIKLAEDAIQ